MKLYILTFMLIPIMTVGQNFDVETLWELPCDSLTSQTAMNICSGKKVHIADSVMITLYTSILTHYESTYDSESSDESLKNDDLQKDYLSQLQKQITAFERSQQDFDKYLSSNSDFISESWSGGTIRPLMVNMYALGLITDRIKMLQNIQDEFIR